ncbi:MAG: transposase [Anaerolineae bacterium]|jgi:transposase-like protein|nr:transposase [Anaerolineae bacterium]
MTTKAKALLTYIHEHQLELPRAFQREVLRLTLQALMDWEVSTMINASHYERIDHRTNYRNGYRSRYWRSSIGEIQLDIPKLRRGTYYPQFLREAERLILQIAQEVFVEQGSEQALIDLAQTLQIETPSQAQLEDLLQNLDALTVRAKRGQVTERYESLALDVIEVNAWQRVYVAVGVKWTGDAELIGYDDHQHWDQFIADLTRRGLQANLWMVLDRDHLLETVQVCLPKTHIRLFTPRAAPMLRLVA